MAMTEAFFKKIDSGIWTPVFTLPRNEKKICTQLQTQGIPVYLPLKRHVNIQPVLSKGKNYCYKRIRHLPMFPGYIFVNITPEALPELQRNRSILRILKISSDQESMLIRELNLIRELEKFAEDEEIEINNGLQAGKTVIFTDGAFAGWQGVVSAVSNDGMAYINLSTIDASVRMQYPTAWCKIVS